VIDNPIARTRWAAIPSGCWSTSDRTLQRQRFALNNPNHVKSLQFVWSGTYSGLAQAVSKVV
jgi:hypothetical protein